MSPPGNAQALAAPRGMPLRDSDVLPGSAHDLTAARELVDIAKSALVLTQFEHKMIG